VTRLAGASLENPGAAECAELGALLARMHLAGRSYGAYLENPRGPKWWRFAAKEVTRFLKKDHQQLLENELAFQAEHRFPDLPRGAVLADLFRDNTLFENGRISGVIDFYFAGIDCLLYDLAVCANDWCLKKDHALDGDLAAALLGAYDAVRPVGALEREAWPVMLRAGALRFWLSRLYDLHLPRPGMLVHAHDPEHFRHVLESRIAKSPRWSA
jgi:homoserine kinase type II